jgi:hypothetical protein
VKHNWVWLLAGWLMVMGLVGCGQAASSPSVEIAPTARPDTPTADAVAATITVEPTGTPEAGPSAPGIGPDEGATPSAGDRYECHMAREDLAQRLGISADTIFVVAVIYQEFSRNAFYCRTTKERISRDERSAVVSGESILLDAAGRTYEYHASDRTVIFCRQLP